MHKCPVSGILLPLTCQAATAGAAPLPTLSVSGGSCPSCPRSGHLAAIAPEGSCLSACVSAKLLSPLSRRQGRVPEQASHDRAFWYMLPAQSFLTPRFSVSLSE